MSPRTCPYSSCLCCQLGSAVWHQNWCGVSPSKWQVPFLQGYSHAGIRKVDELMHKLLLAQSYPCLLDGKVRSPAWNKSPPWIVWFCRERMEWLHELHDCIQALNEIGSVGTYLVKTQKNGPILDSGLGISVGRVKWLPQSEDFWATLNSRNQWLLTVLHFFQWPQIFLGVGMKWDLYAVKTAAL